MFGQRGCTPRARDMEGPSRCRSIEGVTLHPGTDIGAIRWSERVRAPVNCGVSTVSLSGSSGTPGSTGGCRAAPPCRSSTSLLMKSPQLPGGSLAGCRCRSRAAWGCLSMARKSMAELYPAKGVSCQPVAGGWLPRPPGQQQPRHHPHRSSSCAHPLVKDLRKAYQSARLPTLDGAVPAHCPLPMENLCSLGLFIRD